MRCFRKANFAPTFRRSLAKGRMPSMALEDLALTLRRAFQRPGFLLRSGFEAISDSLFIGKARVRYAAPSLWYENTLNLVYRQQVNRADK
jgi:hypothetical protein